MSTTKPFLLVRQFQPGAASKANLQHIQNESSASLPQVSHRSLRLIQSTSKIFIQGMSMKSLHAKLPEIRPKEPTSSHESGASTERWQHRRVTPDTKIFIPRQMKFTARKLDKIQPVNRKCGIKLASLNTSSCRSLGLQVFSREGELDGFTEIDEY